MSKLYDDRIIISKATFEDVEACRFPPDEPINISKAPEWVQSFATWDNGDLRMAIRDTDAALIILAHNETLEAHPGDWLTWIWANEGDELHVYKHDQIELYYFLDETDKRIPKDIPF